MRTDFYSIDHIIRDLYNRTYNFEVFVQFVSKTVLRSKCYVNEWSKICSSNCINGFMGS